MKKKHIKWFPLIFIAVFILAGFVWPNYDAKSIIFRLVAAGAGSYGFLSSSGFKTKKKHE